jgi:ADP-ribose pyrophosphatase YjhB (NUDIX family)
MTYVDSSGRALTDYPRPSVAVDSAVLTVAEGQLQVVLVESDGELRLPGTFLHEGEVLADAVARSLADKAGLSGLKPVQLHVFDELGRDDRGWVLSVAHVAVVPMEALGPLPRLTPVGQAVGLRYDHDRIVQLAVEWLRARYRTLPDPNGLLRAEFTLRDLQLLHEAVLGERVMKDAFRRGMVDGLIETGRMATGTVGKPARLWRRRTTP